MKRTVLLACFCLVGALSVHLLTGSPDPQLSKLNPLKKTSLVDKIFKADPPITTGPADAVTGVPFLDDFRPRVFRSMVRQPRGPKQQFLLSRPGLYAYEARTYCLSAGARGPGGGSAPLYAPLKGKWAGIIENILDRSTEHPEISQRDTQVLIWAVLARTKIDDLPAPVLRTARVLLSPKEIKTINGGALGVVQDQLLKEGLSRLPEPARKVLEAEAKLRRMFSRGETSYERIEEVAVLAGADVPGAGSRDVPRGRWSFHPGGYFVRYLPSKYSKTRVEVSYPPSFTVDRDSEGRIIRLSDEAGRRIEADYDDSVEALTVGGDPGVRGYAFRRIRFVSRTPAESGGAFEYVFNWESSGWVLVGAPAGSSSRQEGTGRFTDAAGRIRWAGEHMSELERSEKGARLAADSAAVGRHGHRESRGRPPSCRERKLVEAASAGRRWPRLHQGRVAGRRFQGPRDGRRRECLGGRTILIGTPLGGLARRSGDRRRGGRGGRGRAASRHLQPRR